MKSAKPFLMFQGDAKAAIDLYQSAFKGFEILDLTMKADEDGSETGEVARALIAVAGQEIMVIDSPPAHDFTFTPSTSIFIECDDADEIDALAAALAEGGNVMMPLDNYGFSERFSWVADRFGVSWQLNLS